MDYIAIGNRIREKRKEHKLTQQKLAEMTGLSINYVGNIERANGIPSIETLVKIANALQISVDFLLQLDLVKVKADAIDEEIINQLKLMTVKEKKHTLEQMRLFQSFCRNLVDNLLE